MCLHWIRIFWNVYLEEANELPTKMQNKENTTFLASSVARGGVGAIAPLIDMSTKMQNGKNTTFLALLRLFYALKWTK